MLWPVEEEKRQQLLDARQAAVDLFFGSSNGLDVLLYLLRGFMRWGYPMNSPDDVSRHNAAREYIEFLMGPEDPTVSDPRYADMLAAAVDFVPSTGQQLKEKGEGWHDARRNRSRKRK